MKQAVQISSHCAEVVPCAFLIQPGFRLIVDSEIQTRVNLRGQFIQFLNRAALKADGVRCMDLKKFHGRPTSSVGSWQ